MFGVGWWVMGFALNHGAKIKPFGEKGFIIRFIRFQICNRRFFLSFLCKIVSRLTGYSGFYKISPPTPLWEGSRVLFNILRRRHAEVLAEDGGEVGQIGEAYGVGHLGDVHLLLLQQAGGLLKADVAYEL